MPDAIRPVTPDADRLIEPDCVVMIRRAIPRPIQDLEAEYSESTEAQLRAELAAERAQTARLREAFNRLRSVIADRVSDDPKRDCDECEDCGKLMMCSYHSVLSEVEEALREVAQEDRSHE